MVQFNQRYLVGIKFMVLLASLGLIGCQEDKTPRFVPVKEAIQMSPLLSELPEKVPEPMIEPEPMPEPEPPPLESYIETSHPQNTYALEREKRASLLRGKRQMLAKYRAAQTTPKPPEPEMPEWDLTDENYQRWDNVPEDVSSFPVKRDRMLTMDMRLMAILESDVHSQIPGRVLLVVNRDVLSADGETILVPAYSKIVCEYEPLSEIGQTRLPLACGRLLTPNGVNVMLNKMQAADQMGRNGLIGKIDNRNTQRYAGAFMMTALSVLPHMVLKKDTQTISNVQNIQTLNSPGNMAANLLSDNFQKVSEKVLEMGVNLRPIIDIKRGSLIQLMPTNDIVMRKPLKKEKEADKVMSDDKERE